MQAPLQARNDSDAAQTDIARTVAQKRVLTDNRPEAVAQRKLAEMMNNSPRVLQQRALSATIHNSPRMVAQRHEMNALFGGAIKPQGDVAMPAEASPAQREEKTNNTGLPNRLKSGIESLSGMSMDHVTVHYNSDKPAQLQAHAYAQGSEIHVGAGQERHLPHEAWHVVQQAQGRVRPTLQMKAGAVNDDPSLEKEADMMGEKAAQLKSDHVARDLVAEERVAGAVTQRVAGFLRGARQSFSSPSRHDEGAPIIQLKLIELNGFQYNLVTNGGKDTSTFINFCSHSNYDFDAEKKTINTRDSNVNFAALSQAFVAWKATQQKEAEAPGPTKEEEVAFGAQQIKVHYNGATITTLTQVGKNNRGIYLVTFPPESEKSEIVVKVLASNYNDARMTKIVTSGATLKPIAEEGSSLAFNVLLAHWEEKRDGMSLMFAVYAKAPGATIENLLVDAGSPDAEFSDAAIELGQQVARFHMSSIASEELLIHNDLNTSNIMFDAETHRFALVDTEDAKLSRDPQLAIHDLVWLVGSVRRALQKRKMHDGEINFLVNTFLITYTEVLAKNSDVRIVNDVLKLVATVK
ncbi:eCIS core domain-containing protein [Janthinobacterium sp. MDB2-8]|uniref:eCIS core domain-containing protein n=1 Tax=Janthinobacterium sp. MDB2-8 TaxID=1259338 RepID=UPI003F2945BF